MEQIFNFITDNFLFIIMALVFLSGFRKSKKKKGEAVEQDIPSKEDYYEDFEMEEDEKDSPIDDLPLPESLKKLMRENAEEEKPFRTEKKKPQPATVKQEAAPRNYPQSHYDNPWSGEGKERSHEVVLPANTIEPQYGSNGKVQSRTVVQPQDKPSYVVDIPNKKQVKDAFKEQKRINQESHAYSVTKMNPLAQMKKQRLVEAIVMKEVLGKPKALQRK